MCLAEMVNATRSRHVVGVLGMPAHHRYEPSCGLHPVSGSSISAEYANDFVLEVGKHLQIVHCLIHWSAVSPG